MEIAPKLYYSGCWNDVGHMLYLPGGERVRGQVVGPWKCLDSPKLHPMQHGKAWLTHFAGWTALGIGDTSFDNRPGSNSVFAMQGTLNFDTMLLMATEKFPHIIERIGLVTLIDRPQ